MCKQNNNLRFIFANNNKMEHQPKDYEIHTKRSLDQKIDLLQENNL